MNQLLHLEQKHRFKHMPQIKEKARDDILLVSLLLRNALQRRREPSSWRGDGGGECAGEKEQRSLRSCLGHGWRWGRMAFPPPQSPTCGKESQMGKKSAVVLRKHPLSSSIMGVLALVPLEMALKWPSFALKYQVLGNQRNLKKKKNISGLRTSLTDVWEGVQSL